MQYNWAKDLNRLCPKEGVQMVNSLTVLNIRNCKSKRRYHPHITLRPVRRTIIRKTKGEERRGGCGEQGTLGHCWWDGKLVRPLRKTYGGSSHS